MKKVEVEIMKRQKSKNSRKIKMNKKAKKF